MTIIGISGKARAGKDTLADFISEESKKIGTITNKSSFAYLLKKMAMESFNLSHRQVYGDLKEVYDERWEKTPREILQLFGEGFRNIHEDYWVVSLLNVLNNFPNHNHVVADVRYFNEYFRIKEEGGYVIRIERDASKRDKITNPNHISETALDDIEFDYVIDNNGSLEDLRQKAIEIVNTIIVPTLNLTKEAL